jgi:hypothetical protein
MGTNEGERSFDLNQINSTAAVGRGGGVYSGLDVVEEEGLVGPEPTAEATDLLIRGLEQTYTSTSNSSR